MIAITNNLRLDDTVRARMQGIPLELFRNNCRKGLEGLLIPVALLLFAVIVAAGTVPVALIFIAELLSQTAGLSRAAAFLITALGGFIVAAALGVVGWSRIRGVGHVLQPSRGEFTRNVTRITYALKRRAPIDGQLSQNRRSLSLTFDP
jgi:hypothetical protein